MRTMSSLRKALLVILCLVVPAAVAFGWWARGHENIAETAVRLLPKDMPEFFRAGCDAIRLSSTDPDWWANKATPELRDAEAPNHFIDLELLQGRELPRTRHEFIALCRELNVEPGKVGYLPYAANEWYQRLVLAFAEYRSRPDDKKVQAKVLYVAGVLSHYTADAAQPLHTTVHFDGRVNPDGTSPRTGIHNKVDALLEHRLPTGEKITVVAGADLFATLVENILDAHKQVDAVYELEPRLPDPNVPGNDQMDESVRTFAWERFRAALKLTTTAWYSAWLDSSKIEVPVWRGGVDRSVESTEVDWRPPRRVCSAPVMIGAVIAAAAALFAAYTYRKRRWSRMLAILMMLVCFQATLIVFPPMSALVGKERRIDWDGMLTDLLGRGLFAGLLVSGAQGRWLWQKPKRQSTGPWDGSDDTEPS